MQLDDELLNSLDQLSVVTGPNLACSCTAFSLPALDGSTTENLKSKSKSIFVPQVRVWLSNRSRKSILVECSG